MSIVPMRMEATARRPGRFLLKKPPAHGALLPTRHFRYLVESPPFARRPVVIDHINAIWPAVLVCTAAFAVGGFVKGVVSIGMPLAALPLFTFVVDVRTAVGLLLLPILVSNVVQGFEGPGTYAFLRRFLPLIACLVLGSFIGSAMLASLEQKQLLLLVGSFAAVAAILSLMNPRLAIPAHGERWLSPPVGFASGVIGGMSTLYGPILIVYLIGLKLPRDEFVKGMSLLYLTAAVCLILGSLSQKTAGTFEFAMSAVGIIPVYFGMLVGRAVRKRINPDIFRKLVLGFLLITGVNMIRQGMGF
jgi:uncharacterized protein